MGERVYPNQLTITTTIIIEIIHNYCGRVREGDASRDSLSSTHEHAHLDTCMRRENMTPLINLAPSY
jgi:hypothetical protein